MNQKTQTIRFSLYIPPTEFEAYYRGEIRQVVVRAYDGRRVAFPANALLRFLTRAGIDGEFEMEIDARGKLIQLRQR